jgi:hypothetical protein
MEDIQTFDNMVDDIVAGEIILANFDTGLEISVSYESIILTDNDPECGFDIVLNGEVLDTLHLFLEARHVARETPVVADWDELLIQ